VAPRHGGKSVRRGWGNKKEYINRVRHWLIVLGKDLGDLSLGSNSDDKSISIVGGWG